MFIRTAAHRRKGTTYRYAQLVESYRRKDGVPAQRVIANLGALPDQTLENLRVALKASKAGKGVVLDHDLEDRFDRTTEVYANLDYLDVAVMRAMWLYWGLTELIDGLVGEKETLVSSGEVLSVLTVQRSVAPGSKLFASELYPKTALPEVTGIAPEHFNNSRLHRALETLHRINPRLMERLPELYQDRDGAFACCFVDVTKTHFEGRCYDKAERTRIRDGSVRKRIGLALLANRQGYPLRWDVVGGRTNDIKAMKGLVGTLDDASWLSGLPVVFDRAMGDEKTVRFLIEKGVLFITAAHANALTSYLDSLPARFLPSVLVTIQAGLTPIQNVTWWKERRAFQLTAGRTTRCEPYVNHSQVGPILPQEAIASVPTTDTDESHEDDIRAVAQAAVDAGLIRIRENLFVKDLGVAEIHAPERLSAKGNKPDCESKKTPFVLRLVAYFNPQMCVDKRQRAQQKLEKFRQFVRDLNESLRNAQVSRNRDKTLAKVRKRLEVDDWLSIFDIDLEPIEVTSKKGKPVRSFECTTTLKEEAWIRRRRYDGFVLLLIHPELPHAAAGLALMYRIKDVIEKGFQTIKSTIKLRPVFHYTDSKVEAHVTICMLALQLQRTLEHRLKLAGLRLTAEAALEALSTCHLNRLCASADGTPVYCVTKPTAMQREILQALDLGHLVDQASVSESIRPRSHD